MQNFKQRLAARVKGAMSQRGKEAAAARRFTVIADFASVLMSDSDVRSGHFSDKDKASMSCNQAGSQFG